MDQLRDARNRIEELQVDSVRNQKLIERLKENRLVELRQQRQLDRSDDEEGRMSGDDFTDNSADLNTHGF
jgi:TolA-binding protein